MQIDQLFEFVYILIDKKQVTAKRNIGTLWSFGLQIKILSPVRLKRSIEEMAEKIYKLYK